MNQKFKTAAQYIGIVLFFIVVVLMLLEYGRSHFAGIARLFGDEKYSAIDTLSVSHKSDTIRLQAIYINNPTVRTIEHTIVQVPIQLQTTSKDDSTHVIGSNGLDSVAILRSYYATHYSAYSDSIIDIFDTSNLAFANGSLTVQQQKLAYRLKKILYAKDVINNSTTVNTQVTKTVTRIPMTEFALGLGASYPAKFWFGAELDISRARIGVNASPPIKGLTNAEWNAQLMLYYKLFPFKSSK